MADDKAKDKDKKEDKGKAEEPAEGDEAAKKKKPLLFKIIIFSSLAVLLIAIVILVSWKVSTIQQDPYQTEKPEKKTEERKFVPILDTLLLGSKESPDFKIVIIDRGEQHNVKCVIYLGFSKEHNEKGPEFFEELQARVPMLREIVYEVMGSKTFEELQVKNLGRVQEELLSKMNETLEKGSIVDIMFSEYIVQ